MADPAHAPASIPDLLDPPALVSPPGAPVPCPAGRRFTLVAPAPQPLSPTILPKTLRRNSAFVLSPGGVSPAASSAGGFPSAVLAGAHSQPHSPMGPTALAISALAGGRSAPGGDAEPAPPPLSTLSGGAFYGFGSSPPAASSALGSFQFPDGSAQPSSPTARKQISAPAAERRPSTINVSDSASLAPMRDLLLRDVGGDVCRTASAPAPVSQPHLATLGEWVRRTASSPAPGGAGPRHNKAPPQGALAAALAAAPPQEAPATAPQDLFEPQILLPPPPPPALSPRSPPPRQRTGGTEARGGPLRHTAGDELRAGDVVVGTGRVRAGGAAAVAAAEVGIVSRPAGQGREHAEVLLRDASGRYTAVAVLPGEVTGTGYSAGDVAEVLAERRDDAAGRIEELRAERDKLREERAHSQNARRRLRAEVKTEHQREHHERRTAVAQARAAVAAAVARTAELQRQKAAAEELVRRRREHRAALQRRRAEQVLDLGFLRSGDFLERITDAERQMRVLTQAEQAQEGGEQ